MSLNTVTTFHFKGRGANDLFNDLLEAYQLPTNLSEAFKAQLKLTYTALNSEMESESENEQK